MINRFIKTNFKKALALFMVLLMIPAFAVSANALSLNFESAEIYVLDEDLKEVLGEIPTEYPSSVKLELNDSADSAYWYVSSGNSVTVDQNGLVTPRAVTWYWYGNYGTTVPQPGQDPTQIKVKYNTGESTVTCVKGGKSASAVINVVDYSDIYVDQKIQSYIDANITPTMTDLKKLEKAAEYAASFEYSVYHSGYNTMIIYGGGDCWASAGLITYMCNEFLGIDATIRYGVNDPGAGSGHRNAVANIDGKFYAAEAGYSMPAPRYYDVYELEGGFSFSYDQGNYTMYQYDGTAEDVIIPATYDGLPVTAIDGAVFFYNNWDSFAPKSVTIPESVVAIDSFAFSGINSLKNFYVHENNPAYTSEDGIIYSKDKSKLLSCPSGKEGVLDIPEGLTEIGDYSVYYAGNITEVTIPEGVSRIGEGAFGDCSSLTKVQLPESLKSIESFAFYNDNNLTEIYIPQGVTEIGENVFSNTESLIIYGEEGSYAQEYAESQNIRFLTEKITETTESEETGIPETSASTPQSTAAEESEPATTKTNDPAETTVTTDSTEASDATKSTTDMSESTTDATENTTDTSETTTDATENTKNPSTPAQTTNTTNTVLTIISGDADSDNKVKVKDVTAIQKYAAGTINFSTEQILAADVNADTKVSIKDATAIQKWLANYKIDYPIGTSINI